MNYIYSDNDLGIQLNPQRKQNVDCLIEISPLFLDRLKFNEIFQNAWKIENPQWSVFKRWKLPLTFSKMADYTGWRNYM